MSVAAADWRPRFFTLWTAQALSLFSSSLVGFTLVWWLTITTGSGTALATGVLVGMLPQMLLGPVAGVLVDRHRRSVIMAAADLGTAAATALLGWLFVTGAAQTWHVYVLMAVRSLGFTFHYPAMLASTSLMVPNEHLSRVTGLNQTLNGAIGIAAPALGALLVAALPMAGVMAIDVVGAVLAVATLVFIRVPNPPARSQEQRRASMLSEIREGLRFVTSWRALTIVMSLSIVLNFVLTPGVSLIPLLVTQHFGGGAAEMAYFEMVWGIGMIAGGLLLAGWGGFRNKMLTSMVGLLGMAVGYGLCGAAPATMLPMALAGYLIGGLANPITNGPMQAVVLAAIPPEMQGRVMALLGTISMAVSPLSLAVAGPVSDWFGVRAWLLVGGVCSLAAAAVVVFVPEVRGMERGRK
jgi:DHA3 family macrolide efflux protein-like MFS transporter